MARDYAALTKQMLRCAPRERAFDASLYSEGAVARARAQWLYRMESEYQSVSSFAGLAAQMLAVRADVDLIGTTLRMAQDELRHAEICAEVVTALGGDPVAEVSEPIIVQALHGDCSPEERVLRNVVFGCCLSETVNCARFVDALDEMTDPMLQEVTRQLLSDEAIHAQFGFHYLESWRGYLEEHPEVRASIAQYLRFAFAVLEADYRRPVSPPRDAETRALGLPDTAHTLEIFQTTVVAAVVPGLERFGIAASDAWAHRSRV